MSATRHEPVLRAEVIEALAPRDGGIYLDGTFGGGGYTRAILEAARTRVLALDRDPAALARGVTLAEQARGQLTLVEARFSEMERIADEQGVPGLDGIALDLGLSSDQLADAGRGFSFQADGPLDMRMSPAGASAADLVNTLDEAALTRLIAVYGEEPRARRVARALVAARAEAPITRTLQLADIVDRAVGGRGAHKIHPATRTFQALRIAVNRELDELAEGLAAAERLLKPAGRLAVVAFHSLEDRIVKRFLATRAGEAGAPSRHRPDRADEPAPSFRLLKRGAVQASPAEVAGNPRARSARLRAAERTAAPPHVFDPWKLGLPQLDLTELVLKGVTP